MHRMHAGPCSPEVMLHRGDSACSVASLQSLHDRQMGSRREGHSPKARLVVTVIEVRWGCHVNSGAGRTRSLRARPCSGRSCRLPILKRFDSESAERIARNEMALDVECVLDCRMDGQEPLR